MAAKRTATSDLNHENWNKEEKKEDAGTFVKASEEVLEKRVIKTAKRRIPNTGDGAAKSAFGSFAGFKTTSTAASPSPFSFLANIKPTTSTNVPTNSNNPLTTKTTSSSNGTIPENGLCATPKLPLKQNPLKTSDDKEKSSAVTSDEKSSEYYAKLKGLNESVTQWIKKHVDTNPFCILTPIFHDYEKHLQAIESKHGQEVKKESSTAVVDDVVVVEKKSSIQDNVQETTEKKVENSIFGSTSASSTLSAWKPEKSLFGTTSSTKSIFSMEPKVENKSSLTVTQEKASPFSKPNTEDKVEDKPEIKPVTIPTATFSFGQSSSTPSSAGFSFGGSKPFTFGAQVAKPEDTSEKTEEKEEDDEPPKPEFKVVTEEGSIFDQRCKVFVKKDGNFGDRGVGTLFLKPTPNDKMQLIVRAGNSLGNILLNTLLSESIPLKRMNKNSIMLVCLPTPDSNPPPTPVLLRVKTSEEADALMEVLEKNRK